jgi:co-chaperonin GroES (HSP10)
MTDVTSTDQGAAGRKGGGGKVSRAVVIVSVVVALAIGGLVGVAVGWKVEQGRVKASVKNIRPVGEVTSVSDDAITVTLKTASGTRTYVVNSGTVVDVAKGGDLSDVEKGSKVLVKNFHNKDGKLEATEIVVLPDSTTLASR